MNIQLPLNLDKLQLETKQELEELGAEQVRLSEYGYIYAEIPSNLPEDQAGKVPALGFISHMDTAPALTGCNVKPQVVKIMMDMTSV